MSEKLTLTNSDRLYKEAWELIPGAVAGIRRPYNFVPGEYPIYLTSAKGGRIIDVDGNEYIDMLCAYGPIIVGHREEEIDNAVIKQIQEKGFCMSLVQEAQNELAQKLIDIIPCCEKAFFMKTGSDATTAAIRVARGYTDRTKILRSGYHGWHDWCVEVKGGIPEKFYEDVFEFKYNDLEGAEKLFKQHGSDLAAVIITPFGHPLGYAVQYPKPGFLEGLKELCEKNGTVLIFDEIRTGFRLSLGGAQELFNVTPDLAVFGKAIANGYPLSVVVGKKEIMNVLEQKVFISSTFFPNSLDQVAALANINFLEKYKVLDVIAKRGKIFGKKIEKILQDCGIPCSFSGAPWMPFITFDKDDQGLYKKRRKAFYTEIIRRKVFLQPYHHGYIAFRHTDEDMDYVANMIAESLEAVKKQI
ncbi:MAG: aminotransferase class III-fold pyridoxal phosphate-dependent enzyme [bacterium]|nr:aminotransferase class III-fold pyridoxal phosphate-dependent enzyme [bacterium]MBU1918375.1 aminotransferase class III-fold pyridoxal phosphate-dependent enzyme [bacterium]